ncbi:MAG TPA: glycoside hydrolase family 43 protein [Polyangia bacterium]|nr:glycoside hydrolase family 43 protein [Polyangia bacterium]
MRPLLYLLAIVVLGCHGSSPSARSADAGTPADPATSDGGGIPGADTDLGAVDGNDLGPAAAPCSTRVTYGQAWIHGASHPAQDDQAAGLVTWDGSCTDDGANSYALLSNGWKPYFAGHAACVIALDYADGCAQPAACSTRVRYGAAWLPPANHAASYDDVGGRLFSDGACVNSGGDSYSTLSNGWAPHFSGSDACALSFEYRGCGGLYANPVMPGGCADPGVLRDGDTYVMSCTSGNAADAFPIYVSTDLVTWTAKGHIFPSAKKPTWAKSDFWAPEIHKVGAHYVAYFSARNSDGKLSIGAASAASALGPFVDLGAPLVHDPAMGLIDASEINAANGTSYLLWKEDGNAVGKPTPIHAQALAADGLSLTGAPSTLITNDQSWEGAVVEGPFMIEHGGMSYLFYSGNSYANATYAVGVARAPSPLGPFTKAAGPIVVTGGAWVGPGHCSVVDTPAGDTYMVYHAWQSGHVNGPGDARLPLTDAVEWVGGWPTVPGAPSTATRPLP